jgi:hypothetical protein
MNKKNLIIAGSVLAVLGVGYLVYKKYFSKTGITKEQKEDLNITIVRTDA